MYKINRKEGFIMYCKNCGEQLNEKQVVCLKCGVEKDKGSKFCQQCGTALPEKAEICLNCGAATKPPKPMLEKNPTAIVMGVAAILLGVFSIFFNSLLEFELSIMLGIGGIVVSTLGRQYESSKKQCTAGLILSIIGLSAGMLTSILSKYFDIFANL
jgi:RNA polymerase subunit RPABC4/transcription elongation factor Spt4